MRRQLTSLCLTAALVPALVACSGDDSPSADRASSPSSSSPTPSTPTTPSSGSTSAASCDSMLSQTDAETVAGSKLGEGQSAGQNGIEACQWSGEESGVQALKAPAEQWAQQLPSVLQQYQSAGVKIPRPVQAKIAQGLNRIQKKEPVSADQACDLFSELTKIPGQAGPDGTLDTVLPSEKQPKGVTAQACADGTYWSVTVVFQSLAKGDVSDVTGRADDALASLTS